MAADVVRDGLVEYVGAQRQMFATGRATRAIDLQSLEGRPGLFAVGPVEALDGEITVLDSRPFVSQVRGDAYVVDHTYRQGAVFLVWTERTTWRDVAIPATVTGYRDLQAFVRSRAAASGIDVTKPFPFLVAGTAAGIRWHINVDRTDGQPITPALFAKSKASYVLTNEAVDIVGFYSEGHPGVFISQYAPAMTPESGATNAIHIHVVSRASSATGHIDDITLGPDMVLRLPTS
jgi:acetolactate decarboxylase